MDNKPLAVIAGSGPGLGQALGTRFHNADFRVITIARSNQGALEEAAENLRADLADEAAVNDVFAHIKAKHGHPSVLIHNTASLVIKPFLETEVADFERTWRAMPLSAMLTCRASIPMMLAHGGTIVISGATASIRGGARFSAFASGKFALRGLAQSLAREFQPQGIHIVHTLLDGIIWSERSKTLHGLDQHKAMQPEDIAEVYFQLTQQPRSTWTQELDLRPDSESF